MPNQSGVLLGPGNLAKAIAEPYTQKTYSVDDYCSYNGYVWKCSTDINSAEAWTEAHWTKVKVIDELISRIPDVSGKADKTGTVLTTTLSRDRKSGTASGDGSIAFGYNATASGQYSQAVGYSPTASGEVAHAEGSNTTASGRYSHSEGEGTTASGQQSHAEGTSTTASGESSHAEGTMTIASGTKGHAEGYNTVAYGDMSHAEGEGAKAYGMDSHAEGAAATVYGTASHGEGGYTTGYGRFIHVGGKHNVPDQTFDAWVSGTSYAVNDRVIYSSKLYTCKTANSDSTFTESKWILGGYSDNTVAEIIGNGSSVSSKSNARLLDWDGNERLKGDLYVNCNSDSTGGNKVLSTADIEDGVSSTATNKALSANRGKLLSEAIANKLNKADAKIAPVLGTGTFDGTSISIPSNADLNDYTTPGTYICSSGTVANTLSHKPDAITANFKLFVNINSGTPTSDWWGAQIILSNATIFIREHNGTSYGDWIEITPRKSYSEIKGSNNNRIGYVNKLNNVIAEVTAQNKSETFPSTGIDLGSEYVADDDYYNLCKYYDGTSNVVGCLFIAYNTSVLRLKTIGGANTSGTYVMGTLTYILK